MNRINIIYENKKPFIVNIILIILLILAVVRTNYGLWNADIPLSDESGYIEQSFNLYEQGSLSANIYFDTYILIFKYISNDPIIAHYYCRFIASLFSVIGLFLLLHSLNGVSMIGAYAMALLWNINLLNTPLIQHGNVSLFAFALACFAGFLWLEDLGRIAKLLSLGILVAVINIRPEYALLLILLSVQQTILWLKQNKNYKQRRMQIVVAIAIILIPIGGTSLSPYIKNHVYQQYSYLDEYLFLGLQQCYTAFSVERDPSLHLAPMTEYDVLMNKNFPGATGFLDAVLINPVEIGRYFFLNGISNLTHLYYLLATHSITLPTGLGTNGWPGWAAIKKIDGYLILLIEQLLICSWIAFGGVWLLKRKRQIQNKQRLWTDDKQVFMLSLAAVSLTALLLLLPSRRYWITMIPLLFWGPAALISEYCVLRSYKSIICFAVVLSFVFVNPVFTSTLNLTPYKDKDVALALRKLIVPEANRPIKVLGFYPQSLMLFSMSGRTESTNNSDVRKGSSYEALVKSREYNLVIIDKSLETTLQYKTEQEFFNNMQENPEIYGYDVLLRTIKRDGPISVFRRRVGIS